MELTGLEQGRRGRLLVVLALDGGSQRLLVRQNWSGVEEIERLVGFESPPSSLFSSLFLCWWAWGGPSFCPPASGDGRGGAVVGGGLRRIWSGGWCLGCSTAMVSDGRSSAVLPYFFPVPLMLGLGLTIALTSGQW
ncbi:cryptochrome 2 [Striga asiatica]|uniref:Cryptochrome 2 n=1 Tax=Striga asiatica TaxID=4170 RepID=A0A5A7PZ50_STRAF|nr:cryptochrome 2 [Striga asiatica]